MRAWLAGALLLGLAGAAGAEGGPEAPSSEDLPFESHDGHGMFGRLTLPASGAPRAIVLYVQTAEGATVDMKRRKSRDETFNYYDLYRQTLAEMQVGFFSYEGRGIRMGDAPPRFEKIDWDVYNTSTLENKVRDALSAIALLRARPGLEKTPLLLMGASESTLLAAEAASRAPKEVAGLVLYGVLATNMRENFRYIMTDGAFLPLRDKFDSDGDGKVTKDEYEADAKGFRANSSLKAAPFEALDADGDGAFTAADLVKLRTRPYIDAIDREDFAVLQEWALSSAAVSVPKEWFKDHFAHAPIWTFLSTLDIPVACFHGARDTNTPIAAVRKLEERAREAGKSKMEFHYFDDLDHSLNIGEYFVHGRMPAGHQAIFEFLRQQSAPDPGAAGDR